VPTKRQNTKPQTKRTSSKKKATKKKATAKRSSSKKKPAAKKATKKKAVKKPAAKKTTKKKVAKKAPAKKKATKRKATAPKSQKKSAKKRTDFNELLVAAGHEEVASLSDIWHRDPDVSAVFESPDYGTTPAASIRAYSGSQVAGMLGHSPATGPAREMAPIIDGTDPYGIQALHEAWAKGTSEGRTFVRTHELRDAFPTGCIRINLVRKWMEDNGWHKVPVIVIEGLTLFSRSVSYEGPPEPQAVPPKVTFLCINDLQHPKPYTPEYHRNYGRHISKLIYELALHHELDPIDLLYQIADKERPTEPPAPTKLPTPVGYVITTVSDANIVRKEQPDRLVVERTAQEVQEMERLARLKALDQLKAETPPVINVKAPPKEPEPVPSPYALGRCSECSTPFATVPYTYSHFTGDSFSITSDVACQLCVPLLKARVEKEGATFTRMEAPKAVPFSNDQEKRAFKILPLIQWANARDAVPLVPVDIEDGYMHMSTVNTVEETARKHFSGAPDLVILEIDLTKVPTIKWEEARGGQLFPHAYSTVPKSAVTQWGPLPETESGFVFPPWVLKT
jgi:uncharacterized protein (DUF952 family)